jgi:RNA polymerase sigma-70 factor, ECF subfamily
MSQHDRLNDELLVLRCQEGDAEVFELLVGRWQRRLWRYAWRLTGDESEAWDATQEAWIGISRMIGRLTDAAAFPAWAYRITGNKCRDSIRRRQRQRKAAENYLELVDRDEQTASAQEQCESLKEALEHLSGRDRALLSLRYEEQFDTSEIAGILGVPEGTVKSRLFYIRQRLRKYLEENNE